VEPKQQRIHTTKVKQVTARPEVSKGERSNDAAHASIPQHERLPVSSKACVCALIQVNEIFNAAAAASGAKISANASHAPSHSNGAV
jgi:hypothetical protein